MICFINIDFNKKDILQMKENKRDELLNAVMDEMIQFGLLQEVYTVDS